jgi:uncharacterized protein (TIGR02147 family)
MLVGVISELALAAKCQRSYLSLVIHGSVHLTPDHAFGLCDYWNLSEPETECFMTLLELARSGSAAYRKHLESKLRAQKRENEDVAKKLNRPRLVAEEKENTYYSAWFWSAIHILVSIPEYQTVSAISERLQLPRSVVQETLKVLEGYKLIRADGGRWKFGSSELHLPKGSQLAILHHSNWRQRGLLDAQLRTENSVHFTVVQSLSHNVYEKIRSSLLRFIADSSRLAGPSKEEELVCMSYDLFRV